MPSASSDADLGRGAAGCDGLAAHLADALPRLYGEGWVFLGVVRGRARGPAPYGRVPVDTPEREYLSREIGNRWHDLAVYGRGLASCG